MTFPSHILSGGQVKVLSLFHSQRVNFWAVVWRDGAILEVYVCATPGSEPAGIKNRVRIEVMTPWRAHAPREQVT